MRRSCCRRSPGGTPSTCTRTIRRPRAPPRTASTRSAHTTSSGTGSDPLRPGGLPARERRVSRLHVGLPDALPRPGRPPRQPAAPVARAGAPDERTRRPVPDGIRVRHPDAPPGLVELGVEGILGDNLACLWPMLRLPVASARLVAVHGAVVRRPASPRLPGRRGRVHSHGRRRSPRRRRAAEASRARGRERLGLAPDEIVFAALGSVTPEKRLPQILRALAAVRETVPAARLVLVGAEASRYDVMRDAEACGVAHRVVRAGIRR